MANDVGEHHRLRGGNLLDILHIENNVLNRLANGRPSNVADLV